VLVRPTGGSSIITDIRGAANSGRGKPTGKYDKLAPPPLTSNPNLARSRRKFSKTDLYVDRKYEIEFKFSMELKTGN